MGDFFHGWKRKTGIVTLVMALAVMAAWVRSFTHFDLITIPLGSEYGLVYKSSHGHFACDLAAFEELPSTHWNATPLSDLRLAETTLDEAGVDSSVFRSLIPSAKTCGFPFSFVALPLTLITIWLFLIKPGKSTRKKIVDPVPAEEA